MITSITSKLSKSEHRSKWKMALPSIDKPFGADEGFVLSAKLSKTVSQSVTS